METFGVVTLEKVERVAPLKANPKTTSGPAEWPITREAEVGGAPGGAELFVLGVDQLLPHPGRAVEHCALDRHPPHPGGLLNTLPWSVTRGDVRRRMLGFLYP